MKNSELQFLEYYKFTKDVKKMHRKCPSIYEDLETFKKAIEIDLINNNYQIPTDTNKYS